MTSTALAYQMMIEERLLTSMTLAEQRGNFFIASMYAYAHAKFMRIPLDQMPRKPAISSAAPTAQIIQEYQTYYFNLLFAICDKAADTLAEVRSKLRKNNNTSIPT
jgi:hypothetical protein